MSSGILTNFEVFANRLSDPILEVELKCTIASELCDSIDLFQPQDGLRFCNLLWPSIKNVLINTPPVFISSHPEQRLRITLIQVIQKLSNTELLRPVPIDIGSTLLHIVRTDNEENSILSLKALYDLHRVYRSSLEGFAISFLDFAVEVYGNTDKMVNDLVTVSDIATPTTSASTPAFFSNSLSPNSTPFDTDSPDSNSKKLPVGILSFKVLSEIPVIIVSILQSNRKLAPTYVSKLLPLVVTMLEIDFNSLYSNHFQSSDSNNKLNSKFRYLIKAQSKVYPFLIPYLFTHIALFFTPATNITFAVTLSFLAFFVRSFGSLLLSYQNQIAKIFVRLLSICPPEAVDTRKEILIAGRHLVGSDLKQAFIPLTTELLDSKCLLGTGLTSIEILRPYALSLVADYIHNVRANLDSMQMSKAVYFYIEFINDTSLSSHIRALSVKLLFSISDSITNLDNKYISRHLLSLILKSFSEVVNEVAIICEIYENSDKLQNIVNEIAQPFQPSSKNPIYLANSDHSQFSNIDHSYSFKNKSILKERLIEKVKFYSGDSMDYIKDAKLLLRSVLLGSIPVVNGLAKSNSIVPEGLDENSNTKPWNDKLLDELELDIFRSLLHNGMLACSIYSIVRDRETSESKVEPHQKYSNSSINPWSSYDVNFGIIDREEEEALESFVKIFATFKPRLIHELFTIEMDHIFNIVVKHPSFVIAIQYMLTLEATSPTITSLLLSYLCHRFEDLGNGGRKCSTMILHLFKLTFLVLTMFPDSNEPVLQKYISQIIKKTIDLSSNSSNPEYYFLLLRSLFQNIGGGRYESLYKEVIPHLHELLEMLNNTIKATHKNSLLQNLLVEISLTVPVRLSVLLPFLSLLMYPLSLSLDSTQNLVTQGLRTLELCIDNLTRKFLDPILIPVINDILKPFWKILSNNNLHPSHAQSAARILGKLGGRNRNLLLLSNLNEFSNSSPSVIFDNPKLFSPSYHSFFSQPSGISTTSEKLLAIPIPFSEFQNNVKFPIIKSLSHAVISLENISDHSSSLKSDFIDIDEPKIPLFSACYSLIKSCLVYFIQNEMKFSLKLDNSIYGLYNESIKLTSLKFASFVSNSQKKLLFPLLSQPLTVSNHLSNFVSSDYVPSPNILFDLIANRDAGQNVNKNNAYKKGLEITRYSESWDLQKEPLLISFHGLFLSCIYKYPGPNTCSVDYLEPIDLLEAIIQWCAYRLVSDSIAILELLECLILNGQDSLKSDNDIVISLKIGLHGIVDTNSIYSSFFESIAESMVSPNYNVRIIGKNALSVLHKSISTICGDNSSSSCWLGCYYSILSSLCLHCYDSDIKSKQYACVAIHHLISLLQSQTDWLEHFSPKIIKALLFTLKDSEENRTLKNDENISKKTILQIISLCNSSPILSPKPEQTSQEPEKNIKTSQPMSPVQPPNPSKSYEESDDIKMAIVAEESDIQTDVKVMSENIEQTNVSTIEKDNLQNNVKALEDHIQSEGNLMKSGDNQSGDNDLSKEVDAQNSNKILDGDIQISDRELNASESQSVEKVNCDDDSQVNDKIPRENNSQNSDNILIEENAKSDDNILIEDDAKNNDKILDKNDTKSDEKSEKITTSASQTSKYSISVENLETLNKFSKNNSASPHNQNEPFVRALSEPFANETSPPSKKIKFNDDYEIYRGTIDVSDTLIIDKLSVVKSHNYNNDPKTLDGIRSGDLESETSLSKNSEESSSSSKPIESKDHDTTSILFSLMPIFAKELANPNNSVRTASRSSLCLIAEKLGKSVTEILFSLKERLLAPIFGKPLRALPHGMQIGSIDAITFYLSLSPSFLEINDGFIRLLSEVLALADAEDQALVSHPAQLRSSQHVLVNLRFTCIHMLTAAMERSELMLDRYNGTRARIISVFFKSLYSRSNEVVEAANIGLKKVLAVQKKLPKDLLQAGLRPILLNLSDYKRLNVPSLEGLARLLLLLTNYFKVEVGRKLLDHLLSWARPNTLKAASDKSAGEIVDIKVMISILDVLYLLPPSASILLNDLVQMVVTMESHICRALSSPFRRPLFIFLNNFSADSVKYFLGKFSDTGLIQFFLNALTKPESFSLRTETSKYYEFFVGLLEKSTTFNSIDEFALVTDKNIINFDPSSFHNSDYPKGFTFHIVRLHFSMLIHAITKFNHTGLAHIDSIIKSMSFLINIHSETSSKLISFDTSDILNSSTSKSISDNDKPKDENAMDIISEGDDDGKFKLKDSKDGVKEDQEVVGTTEMASDPVVVSEDVKKTQALFTEDSILLYVVLPKMINQLSMACLNLFKSALSTDPVSICRFVTLVGSCVILRGNNYISERIESTLLEASSINDLKLTLNSALDFLHSPDVSLSGKVYLINNLISPLVLNSAKNLLNAKSNSLNFLDHLSSIRLFHQRVWVQMVVPGLDERIGIDDRVKASLLQITFRLIRNYQALISDVRKDVIKFGWNFTRSNDTMVKHTAYVVICAFVSAFETPSKIVLQVYISLLRSHQFECRHLVQQALDCLLPVLDKRLGQEGTSASKVDSTSSLNQHTPNNSDHKQSISKTPIWIQWTRLTLQDQGAFLSETIHIYQMIIRHSDIFYPHRDNFLLYLSNAIPRMCLSQNSSLESRTLALDILDLLLKWEEKNQSDHKKSLEDDEKAKLSFSKELNDLFIDNTKSKIDLPIVESSKLESQEVFNQAEDTFKKPSEHSPNKNLQSSVTASGNTPMDIDAEPTNTIKTTPEILTASKSSILLEKDSLAPTGGDNSSKILTDSETLSKSIPVSNKLADDLIFIKKEYVPVITDSRREVIVSILMRLLCIAHEFVIKSGLAERAQNLLFKYIDRKVWKKLHLRISIFERSMQQLQNSNNKTSVIHLLKTLIIVTSEMESDVFEEYFFNLSSMFTKLLANEDLESDPNMSILSKQLYYSASNSESVADESSPQFTFVNYLNTYIQDNLLVPARSLSSLLLLNSVKSYIGEFVSVITPLLIKLFHKACKEHLSKPGRETLEIPRPDTGDINNELTWDLALSLEPPESNGSLLSSMYLLKSFYIELGDQRRPFINALNNLIDRTTDVGVKYSLLVLMREWLFGNIDFSPSIKDKTLLISSLMNLEPTISETSNLEKISLDPESTDNLASYKLSLNEKSSSRLDNSKIFISKPYLGNQFLLLVSQIYSNPSFSRSELTMRLEQVFLVGAMYYNHSIRKKFSDIFNLNLPPSILFRLNYLIETQNWQSVSNKYWIQLVISLLLSSSSNSFVNDLCTCALIYQKSSNLNDCNSEFSKNSSLLGKMTFGTEIPNSNVNYHLKGCIYNDANKATPLIVGSISSNGYFRFSNSESSIAEKSTDDNKKSLGGLTKLFDFLLPSVLSLKVENFVLPIQTLIMNNIHYSHDIWIDFFPSIWENLLLPQRHDISQSFIKLLARPYLKTQALIRPNVVQTILESFCRSSPIPQLPPQLLRYLGQTFEAHYASILLLESSLLNGVENQRMLFEQNSGIEFGSFESLSDLYSQLGEEYMLYGLWSRNCQYAETYSSISLIQSKNWQGSQIMIEQALNKARSGVLPFSEIEYSFWENEWLNSAKNLQSWDMLLELSKVEAQPELGIESGWRLWNLPSEATNIQDLIDSSQNPNSSSKFKWLQAYLTLIKDSASEPKSATFASTSQAVQNPKFQSLLNESINASLVKWSQLPLVGTSQHLELLHMFQLQVELLDALNIYNTFPLTNSENLDKRSLELKSIIQSWRERLPCSTDSINIWSDLVSWRLHVFESINSVYMPFVSTLANSSNKNSGTLGSKPGSTSQSQKSSLNSPELSFLSDSKKIPKGLEIKTNGDSHKALKHGLDSTESNSGISNSISGSQNNKSNVIHNSSDATNAGGSAVTSYAYRGYHEMAWIINQFAKISRKHGLLEVSIQQLNKIYTLPNIEIQEAFLKLCGQAKCYLQRKKDYQTGLDVIGNTNLMYFSASQRAEFFMLKGIFLSKQLKLDDANYAFAAGIQVDLSSGPSWSAWGRFNDERFRSNNNDTGHAVNAISCYLQAAGIIKHPSSRRFLARILWLLSRDDENMTVAAAFDNYKGDVPVWYWVFFIPQLLLLLQSRHFSQSRNILIRIAKQYPQSLHYALGTARDELVSSYRSPSAPANNPANPNAFFQAFNSVSDSGMNSGVDELISKLKTAHPLLALSVETMIDQIKQRLKPTMEEDIYRLVSTLLGTATQHLYQIVMSNGSDLSLSDKVLSNSKFILQRVPDGKAKKVLEHYISYDKIKSFNIPQYIQSISICKKHFSRLISLIPTKALLSRYSPYLVEYEHQKFEEVHVPGQYSQLCESNEDFSRIERFLPLMEISIKQFNVNRTISMLTKDGITLKFSVQHLANRQGKREEQILQMFKILDDFCSPGRSFIENHRISYSINSIISIAPHVRLIKIDKSNFSLFEVFENSFSSQSLDLINFKPLESTTSLSLPNSFSHSPTSDFCSLIPLVYIFNTFPSLVQKLESIEDASISIFDQICKTQVNSNLLTDLVFKSSGSILDFWVYRQNLTFQVGASSFMSYLISATQCFPQNYLISQDSSKITLLNFLPSLTPNIQSLVTDIGLEGIIPTTMNRLARDLIKQELLLKDFLEPFIQNELLLHSSLTPKSPEPSPSTSNSNPNITSNKDLSKLGLNSNSLSIGSSDNNSISLDVINRNVDLIVLRATQLAPEPSKSVSTDKYPSAASLELLNKAAMPSNLVKMDYSWMPWL
ncbi:Transcription-associated protein 1 [Smittium culicis]|uniref:Transcription-associated protein 1 n=1 Tax=Smittium culicis TaxID=133412 RepID=A0A1R1YSJ8_9FUNG|nr:Transcription-associated protein 1 [Smittium culicis]